MSLPKHVTILGGGLTGLTTAYRLRKSLPNAKIVLLEASDRVGGWVQSERHQIRAPSANATGGEDEVWVTLESGPRSIRPRGSKGAAGMLRLIRDLGLEKSLIPIPKSHVSAKNRFLLDPKSHRLVKLPSSPFSMLGRQPRLLSGLLYSLLMEPFKRRGTGLDESVDAFFRRRLGHNVADNLASAMVHGIYATDSRGLSLRSTFEILWEAEKKWGSILLGMILGTKSRAERRAEKGDWEELGALDEERKKWSMYGIEGGLETLTRGLEDAIRKDGNSEIRSGEAVIGVVPDETGIVVTTRDRKFHTDQLISALPPSTLGRLIPDLPYLDQPRTSVGVINFVFPLSPTEIHPPGFGYLVPRCPASENPEGVIGVIFDSTALPSPEESKEVTKMTVMMGGPWWSSYPSSNGSIAPIPSDPAMLVQPALKHLQTTFPSLANVEPALVVPRIHRDCIPTYTPGHGQKMHALHEAIQNSIWRDKLSLVGNGYGGVGVNDCVYSANQVASRSGAGQTATGLEKWAKWE